MSPTTSTLRPDTVVDRSVAEVLLLAAVAFTVGSFLVNELYSLDVWWHVAIGKDILQTGSIPTFDRYSLAGDGRPYHDSHWLFQVLLAAAHKPFGMAGAQLPMIVIWSLALGICYRACRQWIGVGVSAILVLLGSMASVERFLPRAEIVSVLMLILFYERLQKGRYQAPRDLLLLGVAQVVWANSHGLFPLGPFVVGVYWLGSLIERIRHKRGDLRPLTRLFVTVLLATICSPFGIAGWRYAVLLAEEAGTDRPTVFASLGELSATFGQAFRESPAFWFYALILVCVVAAIAHGIHVRSVSPRFWIVVALGLLSLTGRRNVILFTIVAAPFLAESLSGWVGATRRLPRAAVIAATVLVLAGSWYPLSGAFYVALELPTRAGVGVTPSFFPHGLPTLLEAARFKGRILNSNTLGGFYLYHGYPDRLPLTDGRWEIYDRGDLSFILTSGRRSGEWRRVVEEFEIDGVLLAHTSPEANAILPEVSRDAAWRLVYLDRAASLWLTGEESHRLDSVELAHTEDLPEIERVEDGMILNAFLVGVGAGDLQVVNLERTLVFGQRTEYLLEQLGSAQRDLARFEEARATFTSLAERAPDNVTAWNGLAFLAYREGDLVEARELMVRALKEDPGNELMQQNLDRIERQLGAQNQP